MTAESTWFAEYENDPEYLFELASVAVGESIVDCMERLAVTRSELARRLKVSRPRITQILAGDDNLTLKTLVAVGAALESRLKIDFAALVPQDGIDTTPRDTAVGSPDVPIRPTGVVSPGA
jgi:transcriptional regulator with XRE-family HTH domain